MSGFSRPCWFVLAVVLAALLWGACGDEVKPGSPITPPGTSTGASTASTSGGGDSGGAQPAASILYVHNTGGTGVAIRSRCEDGARSGGTGFAEGTEARAITAGTEQCGGWTLIEAGGTTSWVRNEYLAMERPAVGAAPARAGTAAVAPPPAPATGGAVAPPPPVLSVRVEQVLVYGEHLIPVSQLTYRSPDFGLGVGRIGAQPKPGDYVCPVYSYSASRVITLHGVVLQDPDPMGCGFARADTAVIRDVVVSQ